jgi:hypothetical protein
MLKDIPNDEQPPRNMHQAGTDLFCHNWKVVTKHLKSAVRILIVIGHLENGCNWCR